MATALLFSLLVATIVIPARAAREASARRGLRKAVIQMLVFTFFWVMAVAYEYPRLWK